MFIVYTVCSMSTVCLLSENATWHLLSLQQQAILRLKDIPERHKCTIHTWVKRPIKEVFKQFT